MGHNLATKDGREMMAYTGKEPWHVRKFGPHPLPSFAFDETPVSCRSRLRNC